MTLRIVSRKDDYGDEREKIPLVAVLLFVVIQTFVFTSVVISSSPRSPS